MSTLLPVAPAAVSKTAGVASDGVNPRGLLQLARCIVGARPLLKYLALLGLLLVPAALLLRLWADAPRLGFGLGLLGCVLALGLPLLVAPMLLRGLLGQRSLALSPGFPFNCGLLLLLWTLALAAVPALLAWLWDIPIGGLVGLRLFLGVSLYVGLLTWMLGSPRAPLLFSVVPLLLFLGVQALAARLLPLWYSPGALLLLGGGALAGWAGWLWHLHGRHHFSRLPQQFNGSLDGGQDYRQLLGEQRWLFSLTSEPPAATLLLGHPGSWLGRFLQYGQMLLLTPLLCTTLLWFIELNGPGKDFLPLLLLFNLATLTFTPFAFGELAARARCLWLRVDGGRSTLWRFVEQQLLRNYVVLFGISVVLASGVLLVHPALAARWPWALLVLVASLHNGYFSLLARLQQWSWGQFLYLLPVCCGSVALFVLATTRGLPHPALLPVAPLLLLTALCRQRAARAFRRVDWLRLKPARLSRNTAPA